MATNEAIEKVHVLIIGSGPAGYTAAIYAARANMKPVLYQGIQPGGQLTITTEVENYPGYADGVQGPEMMIHFEKQAARMGADIRYGMATKVDFSKQPYRVEIDEEKWIEADAIIISTGASAKWLGLPSEERLNGFGVSACAVCDGFFFRGKEVAIVGAGDTYYLRNKKGCLLANFKPGRGNYAEDGGFYTVRADAYWPNDYGLYNMAGNVAEWTNSYFNESSYNFMSEMSPDVRYDAKDSDPPRMKRKVIRGGSWKDVGYFLQTSTRAFEYQDSAKSYIGFRCVIDLAPRMRK